MNTLILYDSTFGNTGEIARALAGILGEYGTVKLFRISETSSFNTQDADVVIVGGPTQNYGLSPILRTFLAHLSPQALTGLAAVAFDTRYHLALWKSGSAAARIARKLKKAGAFLLLPPQSFFVSGREGPLEEEELTLAREWADQVAKQYAARENATPLLENIGSHSR